MWLAARAPAAAAPQQQPPAGGASSTSQQAASVYGDINGLRLTKIDEVQQYAQESLGAALDSNDSGRHVARVAHLYLARNQLFHLTASDWEVNLIALCRKVFGALPASPPDFGWLGQVSTLDWSGRLPAGGSSTLLWDEIFRDADAVFAVPPSSSSTTAPIAAATRFDSEHLKALRLVQLLHPKEKLNFFQLCFQEDAASSYSRPNYLYLFPTADLPPQAQDVLRKWHAGKQQVYVPELFVSVVGDRISAQSTAFPAFLELSLADWYTFRFVNWFAMAKLNAAPPAAAAALAPHSAVAVAAIHAAHLIHLPHGAGSAAAAGGSGSAPFPPQALHDVLRGNVHLELLSAYFDHFLGASSSSATPRQRAIFRWSVGELWLTRPTPASRVLLDACRVLVFHLDHAQAHEAFFPQLVGFLLLNLREGVFEDSFAQVCGLIHLLLTPWARTRRAGGGAAAAAGTDSAAFVTVNADGYAVLLQAVVDRFDAEPNPSWQCIDALLNLFDGKRGVFTNAVFALVHVKLETGAAHHVVDDDALAQAVHSLPEVVRNCREAMDAVKSAADAGLFFSSSSSTTASLASIRARLEGVVREIAFKQGQQRTSGGGGATAARPRDALLRLAALFQLALPHTAGGAVGLPTTAQAASSAASTIAGSLFALPDRVLTTGVPSWVSSSSASVAAAVGGRLQFRRLTPQGKQQILDGTRDASSSASSSLQYVGDYAKRPVERFEIPALVYVVNSAEWGSRARSWVADSRNVVWFLVMLAFVDLVWGGRRQLGRLTLLVVYSAGAGVLRRFAAAAWAGLFLSLLVLHGVK